jgi:hypothetical protein
VQEVQKKRSADEFQLIQTVETDTVDARRSALQQKVLHSVNDRRG